MERGQTKPPMQRVEELQMCLYQRGIHPELFNIRKVKRVEKPRYQAEIWIVGLAHVITIQVGDKILTELISEDNELLPKAGLAMSFRFRGERDHSQSFGDGLKYILSTQVERMSPQLFPATHRDFVRHGEGNGLFVSYDEWEHEGLAAFSYLDFDARDHEFHVHAFHAFPEEQTLLKTQSIFEVGKPRIVPHW